MKPNRKVFCQENGGITARFSDTKERMVLVHQGRPVYRKIFYLLVSMGSLYLTGLFIFIH